MPSLQIRLQAAKSVAAPLIELEKQIDAALTSHAAVVAASIAGHRTARLPLHAGQEALEQLTIAAERLVAARRAVHEAHVALHDVQIRMGLGTVSYGDHGDTPLVYEKPTAAAELTVVRAA